MTVSKRHFESVAAAIRGRVEEAQRDEGEKRAGRMAALTGLAWDMAAIFAAENPRFNGPRFLKACGMAAAVQSPVPSSPFAWLGP